MKRIYLRDKRQETRDKSPRLEGRTFPEVTSVGNALVRSVKNNFDDKKRNEQVCSLLTQKFEVIGKRAALFLLFCLFSFYLSAQTREVSTLFDSEWINSIDRYGALETKISYFDDGWGVFFGAKGGLIVNQAYSVSLAGYALIPKRTDTNCYIYGHKYKNHNYLKAVYGGALFEYTYASNNLFHFTANTLVGVGGLKISHDTNSNHLAYQYINHPLRAFFTMEPGITANLNLIDKFKATLGFSYRFTPNSSLKYHNKEFATSSIFDGFSINLGILLYEIY